ncbi:MAG: class I SAM-dependent methyltransferase [Planctomycetes bacterium]|nr:class I SAM-dependent methyltransferase [Planctomycetota bacterium]
MHVGLLERPLRPAAAGLTLETDFVAGDRIALERVDCLLCGGRDAEPLIAAGDHLTGLGGEFSVVRCPRCTLAWTNPRPTADCIHLFYPPDYRPWDMREERPGWRGGFRQLVEQAALVRDYGYPEGQGSRVGGGERIEDGGSRMEVRHGGHPPSSILHPPSSTRDARRFLLAALARLWLRRRRQRLNWIPFQPPGRLLDFGCGRGDFLETMRRYGWNVEGLDLSPLVAGYVEGRTGIRIHAGTLPHPDVPPNSFDAVTMWNALEHVHHPREVVAAARRALRPGGLLVVGVPNIDSWAFRRFGRWWWQLELPRHLVHFTPATLCRLLVSEGFAIDAVEHVGRPGTIRKSARRALAAGEPSRDLRRLLRKYPAQRIADRTERAGEADFLRVIARRPYGTVRSAPAPA